LRANSVNDAGDEPYRELAAGVVQQACIDYLGVLKYLYETPKGKNHVAYIIEKLDLEEFFLSDRFEMYTDVSGEKLMHLIQSKAKEDVKEKIREQERKRLQRIGRTDREGDINGKDKEH